MTGAARQAPVFDTSVPSSTVPTCTGCECRPCYCTVDVRCPTSAPVTVCPVTHVQSSSAVSPSVYVAVSLQETKCHALVDTGSSVSLVSTALWRSLCTTSSVPVSAAPVVSGVTGRPLSTTGTVSLSVCTPSFVAVQNFIVAADITSDVILGADFLQQHNVLLDFSRAQLVLDDVKLPLVPLPRVRSLSAAVAAAPTPAHVTTVVPDLSAPTVPAAVAASVPAAVPASVLAAAAPPAAAANAVESLVSRVASSFRVCITQSVSVPPCHEVILPVAPSVCAAGSPAADTSYLIEPLDSFSEKHPTLDVGMSVTSPDNLVINVVNRGTTQITLHANTHIAVCEPVPERADTCAAVDDSPFMPPPPVPVEKIDAYIEKNCCHLSPTDRSTLRDLLLQYHDVFALHPDDHGYCDLAPHKIDTGDHSPIKQQPYRVPFRHREQLQNIINDLLQKGVITPSASPWASPVVLVPKKDGSLRLCVDYRRLNKITTADAYPLPRVDDTLDAFSGSKVFSTLDLASGYWQIAIHPQDQAKTAFVTPLGLYEFTVLPMGCCNGPATFQRLMQTILNNLLTSPDPVCRVFFDDIGLGSATVSLGLDGLRSVFTCLRRYNLKLRLEKCAFLQPRTKFLGVDISADGLHTSASKVHDIVHWRTPTSVREVRGFLGLAGYYRKFVPHFAQAAAPLAALTKKNAKFSWGPACQAAFCVLKKRLSSAPVLAQPDYTSAAAPFILDVDASDFGMGGVLSQVQDGHECVISYGSAILNTAQRNYSTTEKELLAFVHFADVFRYYLVGRAFVVRTDHAALKWLHSLKEPRGRRARWLEQLAELEFTVIHRPGRQHCNADALSRRPPESVAATTRQSPPDQSSPAAPAAPAPACDPGPTVPKPAPDSWLPRFTAAELLAAQKEDPDVSIVLGWHDSSHDVFNSPPAHTLTASSRAVRRYASEIHLLSLRDGVLYRTDPSADSVLQLAVPFSFQADILAAVHADVSGGHLGATKTIDKVKCRFFWPGMSADLRTFVANCQECMSRKSATTGRAPLQSMRAGFPNEIVAMDLVGPLPTSRHGNRYLLVCSDYFSRWPEAYPLPTMTAAAVADVFFRNWICRFGAPEQLHTDQGTQFESELFSELCRLMNIRKTRTTAYHPQGDGLVERLNRTIVSTLRVYVADLPTFWDQYVSTVLLAYRTAKHSSTQFTPAQLMFGRQLRLPIDLVYGSPPTEFVSPAEYVTQLSKSLHHSFDTARRNDNAAHHSQKDHYDLRQRGTAFQVGDSVWLLEPGMRRKLQPPWTGPYRIVHVSPPTSYDIQLINEPSSTSKRVHFNRLKLHARSNAKSSVSQSGPDVPLSEAPLAPTSPCPPPVPLFSWPDADDAPPQPVPPPPPVLLQPAPPAPGPRAHLHRNAGLPVRYRNNYVFPQ